MGQSRYQTALVEDWLQEYVHVGVQMLTCMHAHTHTLGGDVLTMPIAEHRGVGNHKVGHSCFKIYLNLLGSVPVTLVEAW